MAKRKPKIPEREHVWHIDKTIPIGIIIAIFVQTLGAVWWASTVESRLVDNTRRISAYELESSNRDNQFTSVLERMARIEEQSRSTLVFLQRIDTRMDMRDTYGSTVQQYQQPQSARPQTPLQVP